MSVLMSAGPKVPIDLRQRYDQLLDNEDFKKSIFFNTSDVAVVKLRLGLAQNYLFR